MSLRNKLLPLAALAAFAPWPAMAAEINAADTSWMLISTALVLFMTPGLAFFYAGMVGRKNAVSTLYQSMIALGVVGILWAVIGYSLAFTSGTPWIGGTTNMMLEGVGQEPAPLYSNIPHLLFMMFQMMFAIITPALMTGAFAERVRFSAWLLILAVWSLVVYAPVAHWVWGPGGYLASMGALDFAGGLVVHMTAGFSAIVAAILFGKRRDFGNAAKPYDVGYIVLGTAMLWFGWFGFNAGSAVASNGLAAQAFANTFLASAAAMLMWTLYDRIKDGKHTAMGGCIGVVAGLVAITPAAGFVTAGSAMLIGALAGALCNIVARIVKGVFKVDDTLDVFACHGIGGLLGIVMTGILASPAVNTAGNGLLSGGDTLFSANLTGAVMVGAYSMVATFFIIKIVNVVIPVRVSPEHEAMGLDASQHGEVINT